MQSETSFDGCKTKSLVALSASGVSPGSSIKFCGLFLLHAKSSTGILFLTFSQSLLQIFLKLKSNKVFLLFCGGNMTK